MNKSETLRQLAASANANKLASLSQQIETLRTAKMESAEQLAAMLEPLAQAMAALTDETRESLMTMDAQAQQHSERITREIEGAAKICQEAAAMAHHSAQRLENTGNNLEWIHHAMTMATGVASALLVSGLWLWLAPQPTVVNQLDARGVAQYLQPAIEAVRRSKGK